MDMDGQWLRILAIVMASVISAPFILAGARMFIFFGELSGTVKRTEGKLDAFIEKADNLFAAHDRAITVIETQMKYGRRAGDQPQDEAGINA